MANVSPNWEKLDGAYTKRLVLSKKFSWTQNPTAKEKATVNFNAYDQEYIFK